jgi:hypothetical protein
LYSARHLKRHSPNSSNSPYDDRELQLLAPLWVR